MLGSCREQVFSYYYDAQLAVCREFVYSGCGGNANRFSSLSACRSHCMDSATSRAHGNYSLINSKWMKAANLLVFNNGFFALKSNILII